MSMYSQGFIPDGSVTDAKVAALAAIAMSKLNLAITDAQIAVGAAIAKSKLAALGIVDADVAAGAAIAKSKLAALGIVDADVAAGAAIAKSKLAALGIVDADVAAGAAIAASKLAILTSQNIVTGSRAVGTVYQNTSGRPMLVIVAISTSSGTPTGNAYTDASNPPTSSVAQWNASGSDYHLVVFMVLPGNYYKISQTAPVVNSWTEWT